MPYMEVNREVKKVNSKPNGEKEITLVVPREQLRGKLDSLDDILGGKAARWCCIKKLNKSVARRGDSVGGTRKIKKADTGSAE